MIDNFYNITYPNITILKKENILKKIKKTL